MTGLWLTGQATSRTMQFIGTIGGVAATVAMLASLGTFLFRSAATMTSRAIAAVPVDWQIAVLPGIDPAAMEAAVRDTTPIADLNLAQYADVEGFEAAAGGTIQTTGRGKVLGIPAHYAESFPGQFRLLVGTMGEVLVAQQTAANLHVAPGDEITIRASDGSVATVKVSGIVELPNADAMFQAIGVPPGSVPQAPPDNVLVLSATAWHRIFGPQLKARPESIQRQLHVKLIRQNLPGDPVAAHLEAEKSGRHFEVRTAGSALWPIISRPDSKPFARMLSMPDCYSCFWRSRVECSLRSSL